MTDPEFLTPEGERAWTWLRRHLDRANAFWLAFVLTDDLAAQRVLRERVRANRRLHAHPLTVLEPATPAELADLLDDLETHGAAPPGCTWVAASRLADHDWLAAWRVLLLAMNHRRDVLRTELGGLVIAAPPAVKVVAQRESPDLWSVRDLLIELAPRPVLTRSLTEPRDGAEPRPTGGSSQGLGYDSTDRELAEEAQVLLAMPVAELAGSARERVSRAMHRAAARGENQLAAVLLLAQSDGYAAARDSAGALHLVQEALTLPDVEPRTRERLLNSGVDLAMTISELELAHGYVAELVALTQKRVTPDDPEALRDLSKSLTKLGDVTRDLGDPTTARIHYQQALDICRRLAEQLDTPQTHRALSTALERLGNIASDLGDPTTARTHYQQSLTIDRRLAEHLDIPEAHRDLSVTLGRLGDITGYLGDLTTARTHHQQALTIRRRLAEQLDTPQAHRDLSIPLGQLGDIARDLGDPTTARAYYQQALAIHRRLAGQLDTPQAHRDLSITLSRLGDVAHDMGDSTTARAYYEQALTIHRRLAEQLDTPRTHRDLSIALERLGNIARDLSDPTTARTHYQQTLAIRRRLAEQLDTPQAHRDLSITLKRLGNIARDLSDPTTAHTHHQQSLTIDRRLVEQLGTAQALRDLRAGLHNLARTEEDLGNAEAATALRTELATVTDQLTALSDDPSDSPDHPATDPQPGPSAAPPPTDR